MKCEELAAAVETTLIRDSDPDWVKAARDHAAECPACASLLELLRVEEHLGALAAIEPSERLLDSVMSRISHQVRREVHPWQTAGRPAIKYTALAVAGLVLSIANFTPAFGAPELSNLRLSSGLLTSLRMSNYVLEHSPWAMLLIGLAATLLLVGLELPDHPQFNNDAPPAR
jgi:hypothetical protein